MIKNVFVMGAGVMGNGIAAEFRERCSDEDIAGWRLLMQRAESRLVAKFHFLQFQPLLATNLRWGRKDSGFRTSDWGEHIMCEAWA